MLREFEIKSSIFDDADYLLQGGGDPLSGDDEFGALDSLRLDEAFSQFNYSNQDFDS